MRAHAHAHARTHTHTLSSWECAEDIYRRLHQGQDVLLDRYAFSGIAYRSLLPACVCVCVCVCALLDRYASLGIAHRSFLPKRMYMCVYVCMYVCVCVCVCVLLDRYACLGIHRPFLPPAFTHFRPCQDPRTKLSRLLHCYSSPTSSPSSSPSPPRLPSLRPYMMTSCTRQRCQRTRGWMVQAMGAGAAGTRCHFSS